MPKQDCWFCRAGRAGRQHELRPKAACTCARKTRAVSGHAVSAITSVISHRCPPKRLTIVTIRKKRGIACTNSVARIKHIVGESSAHPGETADTDPEKHRTEGARESDPQRVQTAVHHATEDIASKVVGDRTSSRGMEA